MITIIIASYNEPKSTVRAVNAFLNQNIKEDFKIIVMDPFLEVKQYLKAHVKDPRLEFFLDPGEGKSYALNMLFNKISKPSKDNFFILTDGDVYVSKNSVSEIMKIFKDPKVGCVTGKPVPIDPRTNMFGYWAHLVFSGIHRVRKQFSAKDTFFECSGYLFAIRDGIVKQFPLETSEDSIIPYLIWRKGYKIKYAEKAEVYVKNPSNWKDWLAQKVRNVKGHERLSKIATHMPRTKSFFNEIKHGAIFALTFPRNLKEVGYTMALYFARLYMYLRAFKELRQKRQYQDGWRGEVVTESTKTLD